MDAFLSYAREDADVARRLAADLEREGVTVWDQTAIRPGEDWAREIERAISEARNVLFIVPDRPGSWQSSEIALAVASQRSDARKRIVPIIAHPFTELPFFLRRYQALNVSSDSAYEQALPRLVHLLREGPPPEPPTESDRAREHILSVQRQGLRMEQAELARWSRAAHVTLIATIIGAAVTLLVGTIATLSVINLGWIGERSFTTVLAVLFGVLATTVGARLVRTLTGFFSSLFRSERSNR